MKNVKNLVAEGKTLAALNRLQTLVKAEDQETVTALLGRFRRQEEAVNKGLVKYDETVINQINNEINAICRKYQTPATAKNVAAPPVLDNLPLDKEGYLLGRKAALEELHAALQEQHILTLVNGMGGIGKSTLASFYANYPTYKATYAHRFWVTVSDITGEVEEAIIQAFAEPLALYQLPKEAQLQKIEAYFAGLEDKTLLILDNANDKEKVKNALAFLRKCNCKVLLTSRAKINNTKELPLAKLLPEDAFTLFTHYFPAAANQTETLQLLKNIDYHTLLTEFMAKSLAHNPALSLQDLLAITAQQNFTDELLAYTQFTSYHTHTHTQADAEIQPAKYLLQIFPIQNLSEQEQQILRYFSILPAEWIEMDMLKQLLVDKSPQKEAKPKGFFAAIKNLFSKPKEIVKPNTISNDLQLGQILQSLHEKGWLQKSPTNAFACHILLQHLLRQQLQPNAENCELLLQNLYAALRFDGYTNKLTLVPYLPLVATVLTWIKKETQLIANIYNNSAAIYQAIGNYQQALSYDLENIRIKEKILATDDANLATSYSNIAVTYQYLGDYQQALKYGLKDLAICEKVLNAEHPFLAISYSNIAVTYQYLGDYQKALEYGLKALSIREKILSAKHPDLASSYIVVAFIYKSLGDYQQALEYELKALSIFEKVLNAEHPDLATSYNNIAGTYYYLSDYTTAYTYIQKSVVIRTKVLPKGHPDIQDALDTKAIIEDAMRKGK